MFQGRLVELAMCLLRHGLPLLKNVVSQFAKKEQEGKVSRSMLIFCLHEC